MNDNNWSNIFNKDAMIIENSNENIKENEEIEIEPYICKKCIRKQGFDKKNQKYYYYYVCLIDKKRCSPEGSMFGYDCYRRRDTIEEKEVR